MTFSATSRFKLADGQIIHEEERRRALHRDVVDAVVDQVGAHGVMDVHLKGDLQLGAHAVHAGDQHRVDILQLVHGEQAAEAADFAQDAAGKSLVGEIFNALLGAVGTVDVDARVGVSNWRIPGGGGLYRGRLCGVVGHGISPFQRCVGNMPGVGNRKNRSSGGNCSTSARDGRNGFGAAKKLWFY